MALTVSIPIDGYDIRGDRRMVTGTVTFDSSYVTGGEAFTPALFGLAGGIVKELDLDPVGGYSFVPNFTTSTIQVVSAQSNAVLLNNQTTVNAVATTSAQTLMTYQLPASVLVANGMGVRIKAWGITQAGTTNKTLTLKFGATTCITTGVVAANGNQWFLEALVFRQSSSQVQILGEGVASTALLAPNWATANETSTIANTISVALTLGNASTSDAIQQGMLVECLAPTGLTGTTLIEVPNAYDLSALTTRFRAVGF